MNYRHNAGLALDVLRREGPRAFLTKSSRILARKVKDTAYAAPVIDDHCYERSMAELQSLQADEEDVGDVVATTEAYSGRGVYRNIMASYNGEEIAEVVERVDAIDPETIAEVGCGYGGSMYVWSRCLRPGRFLSIDLGNYHRNKNRLFAAFEPDTDFVFLRGDSQSEAMRAEAASQLGDAEIDFLFIDGEHTYEAVSRDFELYSELVAEDGIIALHDIVPSENPRMGVPEFWREISTEYRSEEIVRPPDSAAGGTGLLYLSGEKPDS